MAFCTWMEFMSVSLQIDVDEKMGIEVLYRHLNTKCKRIETPVLPYLLCEFYIVKANQV